ncbi:MAG TPA: nucleotide-binding protein [Candidatus Acidoferrales bacterium]|nr:nucleotide-binding protein [Candidatus Acidoferrales bacterium]
MRSGSDILIRELEYGLRAANLPFLIIYGPRFSGKSELLERTPELCEQFPTEQSLFCLKVDFRADWKSPCDPVRELNAKMVDAASRALPVFRERAVTRRASADFGAVLEAIAKAVLAKHRGVLLLWDHFDYLPNEGMRAVCQQMKLVKESRSKKAICKRIGIIAASARNLAWLNDSKPSPFLGYEPILLPAHAHEEMPGANQQPRLEQWLGGERGLLRVVQALTQRNGCQGKLACLSRRAIADPSGAALLGDAFLHLVNGNGVRELAEELLSQAVIAGSRSPMPDYDEFEETGLFVGGRSPTRYRFRNRLFEAIAQCCLESLRQTPRPHHLAGSIVGLLDQFRECSNRLATSESMTDAVEELRSAWSLVFNGGIPDYYLCFEDRKGDELDWIGWRRDEALRFLAAGEIPPLCRRARDLSANRRDAFICADEGLQCLWHRQEIGTGELVHVMIAQRRNGTPALNESSARHVRRLMTTQEAVLEKCALLEFGKHCMGTGTLQREEAKTMTAKGNKKAAQVDPRLVFIVHGRNLEAKRQVEDLLWKLELKPIEWEAARSMTGKAMPSTLEIIQTGLKKAQAVVVLMTGDDQARLSDDFKEARDPSEHQLTAQPRQNVLIEAGMATALYPDRTLLIEFGPLRPISDFAGLNVVRYDGTPKSKMTIAKRLKDAGCPANTDGVSWME